MPLSRALLTSVFVLIFATLSGRAAQAAAQPPAEPYKAAIVIDAANGKVLFEKNADFVTPPASMTKLMTFAVLHDALRRGSVDLDSVITVHAADSRIGGTQVWLKEKEQFTVEELIYAMMVQSANDAAYALARATAGSVPTFVEWMNEKAQSLGLTNTTFRTPHGLPPANRRVTEGDLTTPRDFVRLSQYLIHETDVLKYTSVANRPFGQSQREQPVQMSNHNKLMGKVAGMDGLKTGFTNSAGFCLAATARREGRRVIVVVMGSPASTTRDLAVAALIEDAFAKLPAIPVIPIPGGARSSAPSSTAPRALASPTAQPAPPAREEPPPVKFTLPKK